jgi:hypothetical protein
VAFKEYSSYDGLGLGQLVGRGEVTSAEPLEEAIVRVERHNGLINAVAFKFYDQAREEARRKPGQGSFLFKESPQDQTLVCLDQNLAEAARKEGFTVLPGDNREAG